MPAVAEESLRPRLLAVTVALLTEDGIDRVSLREIARRAGVSHGAPLRHFPSLSNLLAHVAAQGFRNLTRALDEGVEAAGGVASGRECLLAAARAYCSFAVSEPGPFALMFRFDLLDRAEAALAEASHVAFDRLVKLVVAAQSEGWQSGNDPRLVAGALWGAVHGLVSLWLDEAIQPSTGARRVDELLEPLLSMLVPTRGKR